MYSTSFVSASNISTLPPGLFAIESVILVSGWYADSSPIIAFASTLETAEPVQEWGLLYVVEPSVQQADFN